MFAKSKEFGTVYSASPLEDKIAMIPIASYVSGLNMISFISPEEFCTKFVRISPIEARDEYREMKAES